MRDLGKEGFWKLGIWERRDSGKEGMQERRDAEDKGCRKGGIYDLWDTGKELKPQISYPSM